MGGGTPIGKAPGPLIGRDDDLEYITAFADRAAVSGGALLLSGEAGVGKTVLLDAAVRTPRLETYRFRRQLYYATCAILVSIPSSYSEGVRYPSPF